MIIRRHGHDPDREVVSLLSFRKTEFEDGYMVEYVITPGQSITEVIASVYTEGDNLILQSPDNW